MYISRLSLILILSLISILGKSQEAGILDSLYLGGNVQYNQDLREQMSFPRESVQSGTEGLLIIEIQVNEMAEVSARFMTKLDDAIQNIATKYILSTTSKWLDIGKPYKVYIPIAFSQGGYDFNQISGKVQGFPSEFEFPTLKPVVYSVVRTSTQRIALERKPSDIRTSEEAAREKLEELQREGKIRSPESLKPVYDGVTMKAYIKQKEKLEQNLEKGKTKKAYESVCELIAYNPFDISLLQQRVRLEKELGRDDFRGYDVPWISALLELEKH